MKTSALILLFLLSIICNAQTGIIMTVAGNGGTIYTGDGGAASAASIGGMAEIHFDDAGNYYFAENNNTIRKVSVSGIINTVAGFGTAGFSGDGGPATAAKLNEPIAVICDHFGNLYISDKNNNRIRKVSYSTGIITTIAGTGSFGFSGDGGSATLAEFNYIYGLCFDNIGNIYLSDYDNYRIRKIDTNGNITTVAGNGTFGVSGDGGSATAANLGRVSGLCFDPNGNLIFTDGGRVRKINSITGIVSTIAGNDSIGGSTGDGGYATAATLMLPISVICNSIGDIFIGDLTANNVRVVDTFGKIYRVAGNGVAGFSGDGGQADSAAIWSTRGVVVDNCDNLYISDNGNYRIRKVTFAFNTNIAVSGIASAAISDTISLTASITNPSYHYTITWLNHGIPFATTTTSTVRYVKTMSVDSITAVVYGCSDSAVSGVLVVTNSKAGVPVSKLENIIISPNPVINDLHINNLPQKATYQLHNIIGTTVAHGILNAGNNTLSLHELPPGMYMLEIVGEDGVREVRKVVKE